MKKRILVVDDEVPICNLLSLHLRSHGYEVDSASSARQALEIIEGAPFHLVILDLFLEDADGFEVLQTIKNTYPNLRVIILTGMGYQEDLLQEARARGADGYVSKTLPVDQLLTEMHRVLRSI